MAATDLVLMGKVAATHGIRGQLRIAVYSGSGDSFRSVSSLYLKAGNGAVSEYDIASVTGHGKKLIVTLRDFSNINQVIPLVGSEVLLQREQLPPTEDGEYYWYDLIGLQVVLADGSPLGRLESIIETGSNDVYVVSSGDKEYLVPALEDVVQVDIAAGVVTVTPFAGLFDL
jgi:16S rRNA processing protein RimM